MRRNSFSRLPRRSFLTRSLGALAAAALVAWGRTRGGNVAGGGSAPLTAGRVLAATPACGDTDDHGVTPEQTEGPYFKPSSPERASLVNAGMPGTRVVVTGTVLTTDCAPAARALLDFWQADDAGVYDNTGYRLRGHQYTDDAGRFSLETVVPGLYPGRTRHIHVKVQALNGPALTTQLYFPDEPRNARDGIFDPTLLMNVQDAPDGKQTTFTFVMNT